MVKDLPTDAGDAGSITGSRRSPGEGNGNPLQYSYLGNPVDRRAWRATVHGVANSQTRLSTHTHSPHKSFMRLELLLSPFCRGGN